VTRIVALLTDASSVNVCLDAAAVTAASVPNEEIEAFHPRVRPEAMITTEEIMTPTRHAELTSWLDQRSRAIQEALRIWAIRNPNATQPIWSEVEGDSIEAVVAARGRSADLIVLARPAELDGREALHAAIFDTGRLLLVVPPAETRQLPRRFGHHIAIAWKASPQAASAVMGAVPWLKQAEKVTLILVGADAPPASLAEEAAALLHPHGIDAEPLLLAAGDAEVGACILEAAHACGADCVVMGAYRHNRIVEMILGGVTHHMLHNADLPLFMMH
jgi:nucleotide-binding universal stress UspA family protein